MAVPRGVAERKIEKDTWGETELEPVAELHWVELDDAHRLVVTLGEKLCVQEGDRVPEEVAHPETVALRLGD